MLIIGPVGFYSPHVQSCYETPSIIQLLFTALLTFPVPDSNLLKIKPSTNFSNGINKRRFTAKPWGFQLNQPWKKWRLLEAKYSSLALTGWHFEQNQRHGVLVSLTFSFINQFNIQKDHSRRIYYKTFWIINVVNSF